MKIALVLHDYDPGFGQGRYAVELARSLSRHHTVHILANSFAPAAADAAADAGVRLLRIPAHRFGALSTVLGFIGPSEQAIRRRPNAFDIVHAQGLSCWSADVITAHICNDARSKFDPPRTFRARLFSRIVDPIERRFYLNSNARHLIAVSRRVAADVQLAYQWNRSMTVIYHGLSTSRILPRATRSDRIRARRRFRLDPDLRTWLFAGEARKGLEMVIPRLARHSGVQLLVVSRSDTGRARSLADRLGLAARVVFHGPVHDLSDAFAAADVFVYPSAYDAFGLVTAEAMGAGLPVVTGVNTGAAEWIRPGSNGLICDPDRPESLDAALDQIESDPAFAATMGGRARDTAAQHTWDRCAAETEAVYESVLAGRAKRRP